MWGAPSLPEPQSFHFGCQVQTSALVQALVFFEFRSMSTKFKFKTGQWVCSLPHWPFCLDLKYGICKSLAFAAKMPMISHEVESAQTNMKNTLLKIHSLFAALVVAGSPLCFAGDESQPIKVESFKETI